MGGLLDGDFFRNEGQLVLAFLVASHELELKKMDPKFDHL